MGYPTIPRDLSSCHPMPEVSAKLWWVFKDRVDCMLKTLHVPTADKLMVQNSFNKNEECLVFAIYLSAVTSLSEEECYHQLQQNRQYLVNLYQDALNQALMNADFLRTTNTQVLQALLLMLNVTKGRTDPQLFYILVGVAIRIAQRMGLHRDGSITGLDPFDTEINRRLFWQIPPLDGFAGQFAGTGSGIDMMSWDTKTALNVNDTDLWPGMPEPPIERKGATEMLFHLVKASFVGFYKQFAEEIKVFDGDKAEDAEARASKELMRSRSFSSRSFCGIVIRWTRYISSAL